MWMTFRYYLERRQVGDEAVKLFLDGADPAVLDAGSWSEVMPHLQRESADWDYIMQARRLWQEYARANGRTFKPEEGDIRPVKPI